MEVFFSYLLWLRRSPDLFGEDRRGGYRIDSDYLIYKVKEAQLNALFICFHHLQLEQVAITRSLQTVLTRPKLLT